MVTNDSSAVTQKMSTSTAVGVTIGVILIVATAIMCYFFYKHRTHIGKGKVRIKLLLSSIPVSFFGLSGKEKSSKKYREVTKNKTKNPLHDDEDDDIETGIKNNRKLIKKKISDDKLSLRSSSPTHSLQDEDNEIVKQTIEIEGIVKAGYLYKKSTSIKKDWLKRWFFIKDGRLFYTHSHIELLTGAMKKQLEAIQVANLLVSTVRIISAKEFQIISPGERDSRTGGVYEIQGDDSTDVSTWIEVIKEQIEGSLSKNISQQSSNIDTSSSLYHFVPSESTLNKLKDKNPCCVDCGTSNPDWVSLNLCVMMCIQCSGIHRSLGVHVSKVRSLKLDTWTHNTIKLILNVSNEKFNQFYEHLLTDASNKPNPNSSLSDREAFIVQKYVQKAYLKPSQLSLEGQQRLLLKCASKGDPFGIIYALALGIDVNYVCTKTAKTALHMACENGHVLCVELLHLFDASTGIIDGNGKSPIEVIPSSVDSKRAKLIKEILSAMKHQTMSK